MAHHLESCNERKALFDLQPPNRVTTRTTTTKKGSPKYGDVFLIQVFASYCPEYWLFIEADDMSKLKDLDSFLRDLWLECCGHLSSFTIEEKEYDIEPLSETGNRGMEVILNKALRPGLVFGYEYDFGSSTYLTLNVISYALGRKYDRRKPVRLVARNDPILYVCAACKKADATNICTVCLSEKDRKRSSFCDNCIKRHKCGEDMALPIVNSPRSGECGYAGSAENG